MLETEIIAGEEGKDGHEEGMTSQGTMGEGRSVHQVAVVCLPIEQMFIRGDSFEGCTHNQT